jgi:hypothetical protein
LNSQQIGHLWVDDAELILRLETKPPEEGDHVLRRHIELFSELENPDLTGCHSDPYQRGRRVVIPLIAA